MRDANATKDPCEFVIETTNTHVLKLEVWLKDRIRSRALIGAFDLDWRFSVLVKGDVRMRSKDPSGIWIRRGWHFAREGRPFVREVDYLHTSHNQQQLDVVNVHDDALTGRKHLVSKALADEEACR